jgi:hypothetical protein
MIWAPPSDLSLQQELQHIFFFNKTQNFLDPVTLVRSPTFTKLLSGWLRVLNLIILNTSFLLLFCHFICFNPPHFRNGVGLVFSLFSPYWSFRQRRILGVTQGSGYSFTLFFLQNALKRTTIPHAFEHHAYIQNIPINCKNLTEIWHHQYFDFLTFVKV